MGKKCVKFSWSLAGAFLHFAGGFYKSKLEKLFAEISLVEFVAKYCLISYLKFFESKIFGQKRVDYICIFKFELETLSGVFDYILMIKSKFGQSSDR